jgi:transcriptional regulator with XRE-family HTH domain
MNTSLRFEDVDMSRRIRALLALRGESTVDLARRLGISQPSLSYRLTGRRAYQGRCSVFRVAEALGVPMSTLTHGAPWPDVSGRDI